MQTKTKKQKQSPLRYLFLYATFLIYSASSVCAKLAAQYDLLSMEFCLFYVGVVGLLFVYALVWQQVLKQFPLAFAYANKAIVIPLGMLWGFLLFGERITPLMLLGVAIILVGVWLVAGDQMAGEADE